MATKGFKEAHKALTGMAKRVSGSQAKEGLTAGGKFLVDRHVGYYSGSGDQASKGGGPPRDRWPGLEASTIKAKLKGWGQYRGGRKTRKLINKGILRAAYVFRATRSRVTLWNRETEKTKHLQNSKKRYQVVAVDFDKQDPEGWRKFKRIIQHFLATGKK